VDISKFKHTHTVSVRNYEIDWQGIVHNGNYLLYFEVARVDYFKQIGLNIDERTISGPVRIVIVRNELDYFNAATFGDHLKIYTRASSIKNSSFTCEAVMVNSEKDILISKNIAVMVWTDPNTGKATPVPTEMRKLVDAFEKGDASILWPTLEV
jgi:acyl-CoA thioester hydrolase